MERVPAGVVGGGGASGGVQVLEFVAGVFHEGLGEDRVLSRAVANVLVHEARGLLADALGRVNARPQSGVLGRGVGLAGGLLKALLPTENECGVLLAHLLIRGGENVI